MPSRVYGMFSGLTMSPMTPFWPCRLANLSPSSGTRWLRTLTLTSLEMFSPSVRITLSTQPDSPYRTVPDVSRRFWGVSRSVFSSRNLGGLVLPMSTSPSTTSISGKIRPSSPRFR